MDIAYSCQSLDQKLFLTPGNLFTPKKYFEIARSNVKVSLTWGNKYPLMKAIQLDVRSALLKS